MTILSNANVCFAEPISNRFFFEGEIDFCNYIIDIEEMTRCDSTECGLDADSEI